MSTRDRPEAGSRIDPRGEPRVDPRSDPRVDPRSDPRVDPRSEPRAAARGESPAQAQAGAVSSDDASIGELVGRLGQDLSRLLRAEIALAKAEVKEDATQAARGAGMLAGAGVAGHLLLVFASLAVMFGLGAWMALGWAALIVAVVWAVVAAALATTGRNELRRMPPPMDQTVETVKEDAQWAKKPRG